MSEPAKKLTILVMLVFTFGAWWKAISTFLSGEVMIRRWGGITSPGVLYGLGTFFILLAIWGAWRSELEPSANQSNAFFSRVFFAIIFALGLGCGLGAYAQKLAQESL
jgi:hypothetical protein